MKALNTHQKIYLIRGVDDEVKVDFFVTYHKQAAREYVKKYNRIMNNVKKYFKEATAEQHTAHLIWFCKKDLRAEYKEIELR